MISLPEQLIHQRLKNHLTQAQVGDALGVGERCIGNYEQGIRQPDFQTLVQFAKLYKTNVVIRNDGVHLVESSVLHPCLCEQEALSLLRPYKDSFQISHLDLVFTPDFKLLIETLVETKRPIQLFKNVVQEYFQSSDHPLTFSFWPHSANHPYLFPFDNNQWAQLQCQAIIIKTLDSWHTPHYIDTNGLTFIECLLIEWFFNYCQSKLTTSETSTPTTLAECLLHQRQKRNISQGYLAVLIRNNHPNTTLTYQSISQYERGLRQPKLKTLSLLLDTLSSALIIRPNGQFFCCDRHQLPPFLTSKEYFNQLQQHLSSPYSTYLPLTAGQVLEKLETWEWTTQGFERHYGGFFLPKGFPNFLETHRHQPWSETLETQILNFFQDFLIHQFFFSDASPWGKAYATRIVFQYQDPQKALKKQQEQLQNTISLFKNDSCAELIFFEEMFFTFMECIILDEPLVSFELEPIPLLPPKSCQQS